MNVLNMNDMNDSLCHKCAVKLNVENLTGRDLQMVRDTSSLIQNVQNALSTPLKNRNSLSSHQVNNEMSIMDEV